MSGAYMVRIGDRGRVVLPAELRRQAGLAQGNELIAIAAENGILLLNRDQARRLMGGDKAASIQQLLNEQIASLQTEPSS